MTGRNGVLIFWKQSTPWNDCYQELIIMTMIWDCGGNLSSGVSGSMLVTMLEFEPQMHTRLWHEGCKQSRHLFYRLTFENYEIWSLPNILWKSITYCHPKISLGNLIDDLPLISNLLKEHNATLPNEWTGLPTKITWTPHWWIICIRVNTRNDTTPNTVAQKYSSALSSQHTDWWYNYCNECYNDWTNPDVDFFCL